jgi:hypothetical protein
VWCDDTVIARFSEVYRCHVLHDSFFALIDHQFSCNQQVVGSDPTAGSVKIFLLFLFQASAPVDQSAEENESERSANDL